MFKAQLYRGPVDFEACEIDTQKFVAQHLNILEIKYLYSLSVKLAQEPNESDLSQMNLVKN